MNEILQLIHKYVDECEHSMAILHGMDSGPEKTAVIVRQRGKRDAAKAEMLEELHKLIEDHEIVEWLIKHPQKATARISKDDKMEFKEANFWGISAQGRSFREAMVEVMRQVR